jgi:hypothetical protein
LARSRRRRGFGNWKRRGCRAGRWSRITKPVGGPTSGHDFELNPFQSQPAQGQEEEEDDEEEEKQEAQEEALRVIKLIDLIEPIQERRFQQCVFGGEEEEAPPMEDRRQGQEGAFVQSDPCSSVETEES